MAAGADGGHGDFQRQAARAVAMIERLAGVDRLRAGAALNAAEGNIKAGALRALGATPGEAPGLLKETLHILRAARAGAAGMEPQA